MRGNFACTTMNLINFDRFLPSNCPNKQEIMQLRLIHCVCNALYISVTRFLCAQNLKIRTADLHEISRLGVSSPLIVYHAFVSKSDSKI